MGRGTLSPAANDRFRDLLEKLVEAEGGRGHGGISKLALKVGRSQGRLSAILNGDGATGELVAAVCELAAVPEASIYAAPSDDANLPPDASINRAKAVKAARLIGLSEVAIQKVRRMPVPKDREDPPPLPWFEHILTHHRLGSGPPSTPKT